MMQWRSSSRRKCENWKFSSGKRRGLNGGGASHGARAASLAMLLLASAAAFRGPAVNHADLQVFGHSGQPRFRYEPRVRPPPSAAQGASSS